MSFCHLCQKDELFESKEQIKIYFECIDEKACKLKQNEQNEKNQIAIEKDKNERQLYEHLSKEEQLQQRFKINMDDLVEIPIRDASIHYYDEKNDVVYSWVLSKYWKISNNSLKQNKTDWLMLKIKLIGSC